MTVKLGSKLFDLICIVKEKENNDANVRLTKYEDNPERLAGTVVVLPAWRRLLWGRQRRGWILGVPSVVRTEWEGRQMRRFSIKKVWETSLNTERQPCAATGSGRMPDSRVEDWRFHKYPQSHKQAGSSWRLNSRLWHLYHFSVIFIIWRFNLQVLVSRHWLSGCLLHNSTCGER